MPEKSFLDMLWVVVSAGLVFLMQAGFLCLESGLTRSKNNINVAIKNLADFGLSTVAFWAVGYALMFGATTAGWVGLDDFLLDFSQARVWITVFFFFQAMFCGTTVTILSGAIAERVKFSAYLLMGGLVSAIIYPLFGHWAWNGVDTGDPAGWLAIRGFVDFAGSTVVHSVGGWVSLAVLLIVGPRAGRFPKEGPPQKISGSNIPLATLGVFLLWFGWFGFNGGSTLAMNSQVPHVLANTVMAGASGMVGALLLGWLVRSRADIDLVLNGSLAGLVAITANAHAVSAASAVAIGAVGGMVMLACDDLLEWLRIDDAVSAIPVHLGAGVWGTLAVALFGQPELLGTGLSFWAQLQVQVLGILTCFLWTFGATYYVMLAIDHVFSLRVTPDEEHIGLNISEHGASTELIDLFTAMDEQSRTGDLSLRVPVEPFTEVGQIAGRYNQVMTALEEAVARTEAVVRTARDGIITFSKTTLQIMPTPNPEAEAIFGYQGAQLVGQPISAIVQMPVDTPYFDPRSLFAEAATTHTYRETMGQRADGSSFPVEYVVTEATIGRESFYIGTFRDITERKQTENELRQYREHLEEQVALRTAELINTNQKLLQEISEREQAEAALAVARDQALEASRLKSQLLATVSHELRTPLNAMLGYTDMLQKGHRGRLSNPQLHLVSRIIFNIQKLTSLINDLLSRSQLEKGEIKLQLTTFAPAELINNLGVLLGPQLQAKKLPLIYEISPDLPPSLTGDIHRLQDILINLVNNALKFTEIGEIRIQLLRPDPTHWAIRVSDTGRGIPPEAQSYIFDAFRQVDHPTTRTYGGAGLGLSIVKHLTGLMGGQITLTSRLGQGSNFTITLPLATDRQTLPQATAPHSLEERMPNDHIHLE